MRANSRFKSAVSAAALSAGLVVTGAAVVSLSGISSAYAAVVSSIDVRGNQRIESETIRTYVGIAPGRNFNNADIDEAVKRLFATGLFSDVRINQVGSTLVVQVTEYSIVNNVIFQGNRRVKDADLQAQTQLGPRQPFSQALLDRDLEVIRAAYARVGRDDTVVTSQVVDLGQNRVNVIFNIEEGGRTKINSITFEGNSGYSDGRLRDVISTKQSNFLSWLTRNDIYDEQRVRADEEALRRFYFNRGYADFQVLSADGVLDEANNEYNIVITVDEGARYTYGAIDIESTVPGVDVSGLNSLVETRTGGTYSAKQIEDTIIALTERLAGQGYAFAQVTPRGDRDFTNNTISIVYMIDQGPRAYVERIEIRGNDRTRDYVIRREFDVAEGDAFNQVLIQRARRRLEALDFFETVNISTAPGSQADQVVLLVEVVEKSTGEFSIGAGYTLGQGIDGSSGVTVEGSVTERNFLGRGQRIRVSASGGKNARDFAFSFTEPYFLGQRISAGFDVYRQNREFPRSGYDRELTGGTVRFGLPITQALSTQIAYNLVRETYGYSGDCTVDPGSCELSPRIREAIDDFSPWIKSSVSGSLIYNTLDDPRDPRQGFYANFTTEVAGLGGDAQWVKFTGRGTYYQTLSDEYDLVGMLTAGGGHIIGYGDSPLRVFDYFQSNDRIIRGFEFNGIGPTESGDHIGGATYFHASAEAQFPLPLISRDFGFKGAVFADAATLFGNDLEGAVGTDMEWRASVGAGIIWASPFGPLRVDYAVPVVKQDGDIVQNFNFGISSSF
jgi:outer membrane protein insertion porin family